MLQRMRAGVFCIAVAIDDSGRNHCRLPDSRGCRAVRRGRSGGGPMDVVPRPAGVFSPAGFGSDLLSSLFDCRFCLDERRGSHAR